MTESTAEARSDTEAGGDAVSGAPIRRVDVLGVQVSAINMAMAIDEMARWVDAGERHYVCISGVHGVTESQHDPELLAIHNHSGLTTPDGMPLVWCGRKAGAWWMDRVYGPDLMLAMAQRCAEEGWGWYLYGGKEGIPELLAEKLTARFPGLKIVGTYSPPFRALTPEEKQQVVDDIDGSGAQFVWVGLSTPKQERWMWEFRPLLKGPAALVGVGAAFDMHAGTLPQAPHWMQRSGLEWLYRMAREPRRLTKRYLKANPQFIAKILRRPPSFVDG